MVLDADRRLRHVQDEVVVAVRLDGPGPARRSTGPTEREGCFGFRGFRGWPVADVVSSRERFYPGRVRDAVAWLAGDAGQGHCLVVGARSAGNRGPGGTVGGGR
ncbi:hypothetical protein OOK41_21610 [Micromonospora sp. NBC_01655]|uniref:hypothetical protein n=1 Tax=Micromonospora sp. NBC_01655 TaxID=2975983 RepID=UPI00225384CB|nr:hypothetical protein [Micromonospora sp. NBC_01655]MCX4472876.1 hypothetical protein [Micromonospora sp. NBC_01655]